MIAAENTTIQVKLQCDDYTVDRLQVETDEWIGYLNTKISADGVNVDQVGIMPVGGKSPSDLITAVGTIGVAVAPFVPLLIPFVQGIVKSLGDMPLFGGRRGSVEITVGGSSIKIDVVNGKPILDNTKLEELTALAAKHNKSQSE